MKNRKKVDQSMTETIIAKETKNSCCMAWLCGVNNITVDARDLYNPQDVRMAQALEKLLHWQLGNYCPTCGKQLSKEG